MEFPRPDDFEPEFELRVSEYVSELRFNAYLETPDGVAALEMLRLYAPGRDLVDVVTELLSRA